MCADVLCLVFVLFGALIVLSDPEPTPLQERLEVLANQIGIGGAGVAIVLFFVLIIFWSVDIVSNNKSTSRRTGNCTLFLIVNEFYDLACARILGFVAFFHFPLFCLSLCMMKYFMNTFRFRIKFAVCVELFHRRHHRCGGCCP
jgi:hypothetical protein